MNALGLMNNKQSPSSQGTSSAAKKNTPPPTGINKVYAVVKRNVFEPIQHLFHGFNMEYKTVKSFVSRIVWVCTAISVQVILPLFFEVHIYYLFRRIVDREQTVQEVEMRHENFLNPSSTSSKTTPTVNVNSLV
ncbi:hypothetical protein WA158_006510 [Blastocystis sp. Blastoise]